MATGLIATAFGVVVVESADEDLEVAEPRPRLVGFDPDTGGRRWQTDLPGEAWNTAHGVAREDTLIVAQNKVGPSFACDLLTGGRIFDLPHGTVALVDRDLVILTDDQSRVRALDWPTPRTLPAERPRWEVEGLTAFVSGGALVLGRADGATRAVDRMTGEVLWEITTDIASHHGPLVDAHGALVHSVTYRENERPSRRYRSNLTSLHPPTTCTRGPKGRQTPRSSRFMSAALPANSRR